MANQPFLTSRYGKLLHNAVGARKLSIATLGESHAGNQYLGAAIQYACWRHYNADVTFDHRTYATGGQDFSIGGTTISHLTGTQVPNFATRPADIAFIASGYNDAPTTSALAITAANSVIAAANTLLSTGAIMVAICGVSVGNGNQMAYQTYNQVIKNYAALNSAVVFLDITSVVADPTNTATATAFRNIGSNPLGTYQSYTQDGTHWSGFAIRQIAPLIADVLRKVAPQRRPRLELNAGTYSPANTPYANLLGNAGNMIGTAGVYAGALNVGVAGVDAASRVNIEKTGSIVVTPSIVTGAGGERIQRMVVSGTSASDIIQFFIPPSITLPNNGDATRFMDVEAVVTLTTVNMLTDITLRPVSSTYDTAKMGSNNAIASSRYTDGTSEELFIYSLFPAPVPSANNPLFNMIFQFATGTVSGTIDVSKFSAMLVAPQP